MKEGSKNWKENMTPREVRWCLRQIRRKIFWEYNNCIVRDFRSARLWVGKQRKIFKRIESIEKGDGKWHIYEPCNWVAYRWSWKKFQYDKYLLGFNYHCQEWDD